MSHERKEEGFVLLLVLVLIVVTISTVYAMAKTSTLEILGARYRADRVRADLLAQAGPRLAMRALQDDLTGVDALGQSVESNQDAWALLGEKPIEFEGGGFLKIHVRDIGARVNINSLVDAAGEPKGEQSRSFLKETFRYIVDTQPALLEEASYTDEKINDLSDAILDWLDSNEQTRLGTPEEEFYVGIEKGESAPVNRPVFSLDELAPIPGMGALLLEAMKSYFTTYPLFPGNDAGGINLNTAPAHVLGLLYHGSGLDYRLLKSRDILEILRARKEGRVFCQGQNDDRCVTLSDVLGIVDAGEAFFPPLQYKGSVFQIRVEAGYGETRSCVTSIVDRDVAPPADTLYYRLGC